MCKRVMTALLLIAACVLLTANVYAAERVFGKGVASSDTTLISELLAHPAEYLDKKVCVEGMVVGLCKKRGCWMDLASDKEYEKIQIKVEDGEIIFPMDLMGETARAEGVLTALPLTLEQTRQYLSHEAECQGEKFDAESITEAVTLYRIQGTGAIVHESEADLVDEAEVSVE